MCKNCGNPNLTSRSHYEFMIQERSDRWQKALGWARAHQAGKESAQAELGSVRSQLQNMQAQLQQANGEAQNARTEEHAIQAQLQSKQKESEQYQQQTTALQLKTQALEEQLKREIQQNQQQLKELQEVSNKTKLLEEALKAIGQNNILIEKILHDSRQIFDGGSPPSAYALAVNSGATLFVSNLSSAKEGDVDINTVVKENSKTLSQNH